MIFLQIPVLPFALGVYLPLSLSAATMAGGLMRAYDQEMAAIFHSEKKSRHST